jgi:hypothetical protein
MAINVPNLVVRDAIQVLNHKDVNGPLQHLKLIGIQTHSKGVLNSNRPNFCVVYGQPIRRGLSWLVSFMSVNNATT